MRYCDSLVRYRRAKTREVPVRRVVIGGDNPVRVQSMANTDTNDTEGSVAQALRIAAAGGELVRFTAQGRKEALNLSAIGNRLRERGCDVPLVADIHFNPLAATLAAERVEKVRINPGNFVDKRADFTHIEFTDTEYAEELSRLRDKFVDLLNICKVHDTALRIGVNHGSLSDRIMSRYGDTPEGMVESAMEFLRICREENFHRVVLSMKSSNVRVMVHAYRRLVARMREENMNYPLHLGVTEAGDGEDGRVKSAVGIGALLADGLGDTIRVSLTEAPENEIPVARGLARYFLGREAHASIPEIKEEYYSPYEYVKRKSHPNGSIGGDNPPVVVVSGPDTVDEPAADFFVTNEASLGWKSLTVADLTSRTVSELADDPSRVIVLDTDNLNGPAEQRAFFLLLAEYGIENPVIIRRKYDEPDLDTFRIRAAADLGLLFLDGFGDGLWIENPAIAPREVSSLSFSILQAARVRVSKTEYIACPGCGRTLFDLQGTLAEIRRRTNHLKGLKIGVMGCIVNGPGEMADADYGYVGAGPGKVTLYKNKEVVRCNIPQQEAIEALVELIKSSGDWNNSSKGEAAGRDKQ